MRKILLILGVPILAIILILLFHDADSVNPDYQENQNAARPIIAAIDQYYAVHQNYPNSLEELSPNYSNNSTESTAGNGFSYRLDDPDGYYLCFAQGPFMDINQVGCCYTPDSGWECSPGE